MVLYSIHIHGPVSCTTGHAERWFVTRARAVARGVGGMQRARARARAEECRCSGLGTEGDWRGTGEISNAADVSTVMWLALANGRLEMSMPWWMCLVAFFSHAKHGIWISLACGIHEHVHDEACKIPPQAFKSRRRYKRGMRVATELVGCVSGCCLARWNFT